MPEDMNAEVKRMSFLVRESQVQIETLMSKMNEMIGEINSTQEKLKKLEAWKADHEKRELIQGQPKFSNHAPTEHMDPYRAEQMKNIQAQQAMMNGGVQEAPQQHAMPSSASTRAPDNGVSIEKMFYFGKK